MVDCVEQLDLIPGAARVCIEFDTSLELARGRARIGPRRSPLRTPAQARELARAVVARPELELARRHGLRGPRRRASATARRTRSWPPACARCSARPSRRSPSAAPPSSPPCARWPTIQFVNGGGSGSIDTTAAEPVVTEITAGSGLLAPALFDRYRAFSPRPAALFCLPVVRRPSEAIATLLGGGYVASGPAGRDRLPQPYLPPGLRLTALEGAGEVADPADRPQRSRARGRRPRLPAPREGRRAVRAVRHAVPRARRRCRRRGADLPRRGQGVPVSADALQRARRAAPRRAARALLPHARLGPRRRRRAPGGAAARVARRCRASRAAARSARGSTRSPRTRAST